MGVSVGGGTVFDGVGLDTVVGLLGTCVAVGGKDVLVGRGVNPVVGVLVGPGV